MMNSIRNLILLCLLSVLFLNCDWNNKFTFDIAKFAQQEPLVLIIKHRQDSLSSVIAEQVTKGLYYTKIPNQSIDLGIISSGLVIPSSVKSIVVTSYLISNISSNDIEKLTTFVAEGNSIVFLGAVTFDSFAFLQGILPFSDYEIDREAKGVYMLSDIFPNHAGKLYFSNVEPTHGGLKRNNFTNKIKLAAVAGNDPNYPLVVINDIGLGEVITINSELLYEKLYRGLIISTILKGLDGVPYSVANVATIFLDDFPAPLYNEKLEPIDTEYDVTHADFVTNIWWPDMQALADTFNLTYSAMTAFNYNANVIPPFDFQEWTSGKVYIDNNEIIASAYLARDILSTKHELAFHGYNHFSLDLNDWDNVNFMASSIQAARKRWRIDDLGDLPTSYVPPTNYIDSVGISALMKGMPSIKYMSSLYLGQIENGTGREFGVDPYSIGNRLFDYPRITSGFTMNENSLFEQQGMQLITGIWTHFVHPDDVFQVNQRDEDQFASRNPLRLGWKSHTVYGYGLYHVFRDRINFTNDRYKGIRYVSASTGAQITEDWLNKFVLRDLGQFQNKLFMIKDPDYETKSSLNDPNNYWFTYVSDSNKDEFEIALSKQSIGYATSTFWDGNLYQFGSNLDSLTYPNFSQQNTFDQQTISSELSSVINRSRAYQTEFTDEPFNLIGGALEDELAWTDTRLNDAIKMYQKNPANVKAQEQLIQLSIEFGDIRRAILILEKKLLSSPVWLQTDIERLFTYYGWEGLVNEAENFLERLWLRYPTVEVINIKNYAVTLLGIYSPDFALRWIIREKNLNPNDEETTLEYTRIIESALNWQEVKKELIRLIKNNPKSDSLYAYTLQRSFFYENTDSSIALIETYPTNIHPQIDIFATNIALIYAYDIGDYSRALYWAERDKNFDSRIKLDWLVQLNLYSEYKILSEQLLKDNPNEDSLKVLIGSQLYYEGFVDEAREIIYPLFLKDRQGKTTAHNLINSEIQFMSYEDRKSLYDNYPAFFNNNELTRLSSDLRWTEGIKLSAFGEYTNDNFNNKFWRYGISSQFGNRRRKTHTFKIENLSFENPGVATLSTFTGLSYDYSHKYSDQQSEFKAGGGLFTGTSNLVSEVYTSISKSGVSSFTLGSLAFGPILTNAAVIENYYQIKSEFYREDIWWQKKRWISSFSGSGSYYTDSVFGFELSSRLYRQFIINQFRIRPLVSLIWSDATKNYINAIPYFTPDNYFEQGIGLDFRFRNPDTFEYNTVIDLELMAKKEKIAGKFGSGRIQIEHKFKRFWELRIGSEYSTSELYRSNRVFFTLSYYFNHSLPTFSNNEAN